MEIYGFLESQSRPIADTKRRAWVGDVCDGEAELRWPATGEAPIPNCFADTLVLCFADDTELWRLTLPGREGDALRPGDELAHSLTLDVY